MTLPPFLSTPSGWRATCRSTGHHPHPRGHFYPRPPGGGRLPSSRQVRVCRSISIHALRVEGDRGLRRQLWTGDDFYPRPPGGGRRLSSLSDAESGAFLSTPSGWRATETLTGLLPFSQNFYPRPPGGGRLQRLSNPNWSCYFYPRPPGGGRRGSLQGAIMTHKISIHALRVEGDCRPSDA